MPTDDLPAAERLELPRWPRYVLLAFVAESLLLGALQLADVDRLIPLLLMCLWVPTVIATAAALTLHLWARLLNRTRSRAK
jgi:hypothetical protein